MPKNPIRFLAAGAALTALATLAGCAADPLADVARLDEVQVSRPAPVVEAVAAPIETDPETGFFQRLMRKREIAPAGTVDREDGAEPAAKPSAAGPATAGPDVNRPGMPVAASEPSGKRLFGLFRRTPQAGETATDSAAEGAAGQLAASDPAPGDPAAGDPVATETPQAAPEPRKRGLFGLPRKTRPDAAPQVQLAALPAPETETGAEARTGTGGDTGAEPEAGPAAETRARQGLFSSRKAARLTGPNRATAPDARDAAPGEVLPFGEIARACHVKRGALGQVVAKFPERSAKYKVHDSAPGNLGLHTFYLTGFSDGCPRQFTAALAVFGTAGMYETLRYGLPVKARSKKPTDLAYEKLKSRVCGVGRTKPCGAKISRMEKSVVFLSLYNRFEGAQGWTNLLLSDGKVVALDRDG